MTKFVNKQAICQTVSSEIDYIATQNCQIRAFSLFNPSADNVECTVSLNGKVFVKKTVVANGSEVLSSLFNQQIDKDQKLNIVGNGLNVWCSIVEIVE